MNDKYSPTSNCQHPVDVPVPEKLQHFMHDNEITWYQEAQIGMTTIVSWHGLIVLLPHIFFAAQPTANILGINRLYCNPTTIDPVWHTSVVVLFNDSHPASFWDNSSCHTRWEHKTQWTDYSTWHPPACALDNSMNMMFPVSMTPLASWHFLSLWTTSANLNLLFIKMLNDSSFLSVIKLHVLINNISWW